MNKRILSVLAALVLISGCGVAYNSNSGTNGTRDSATQLSTGIAITEKCDADVGNNEDWYTFTPSEPGTINININASSTENNNLLQLFDGFGRELKSLNIDPSKSVYSFDPIEITNVSADLRYFVKVTCLAGQTTYTIQTTLTPPPVPEVPSGNGNAGNGSGNNGEASSTQDDTSNAGQSSGRHHRSKKDTQTTQPVEEETEPVQTYEGMIVLITPSETEDTSIKIQNVGDKTNTKPGDKATLKGLNRKVKLVSCSKNYCMGSVKATPEELKRYDVVIVESK